MQYFQVIKTSVFSKLARLYFLLLFLMAYNGVMPNIKNLQDGSYPYAKQLFLVTQSTSGEVAGKFIAFMQSPAGRKILNNNGLLPAAR